MKERYPVGVIVKVDISGQTTPLYFSFKDERTFEIEKVRRVSKIIAEELNSLVTLYEVESGGKKYQLAHSPHNKWYLYVNRD